MWIDTHCHLHDPRFDEDRQTVIDRALQENIEAMICIGCELSDIPKAQALAMAHPAIYFSAGIHPHEAQKAPADFAQVLAQWAKDPKCVGIGECGLDFFYEHSPKDIQLDVFTQQIYLAVQTQKPLIIHLRDAWQECFDLVQSHQNQLANVVIHCFSGTWDWAQKWLEIGAHISLSGIVTFKNALDLQEVAQKVPLDKLLVETDAPYLAPIPFRGKRNEPVFVKATGQKIADLRQISPEEVARQTTSNAKRVFRI